MTAIEQTTLAFAGVYSAITYQGVELVTCAVITTDALGPLSYVHDRMPLVLPADRWDAWLDPDRADPISLLDPDIAAPDQIEIRPVGRAVGNVRNNGPDLIAEQIIGEG